MNTDNTAPVAVVTGAARGIGRAIVDRFRADGYRVAGVDRDWSDTPGTPDHGPTMTRPGLLRITADVSVPEEIDRAVATVDSEWGRIDALVNNAGVGIWRAPEDLAVEEWDTVINTNLRGTFLFSRAVAATMRRAVAGAIVNIASTRALMSEPDSEAYAASKGGIVALTHALAASLSRDRIRVNCISPGWIETREYETLAESDHRQHWAGRVGTPEDVAAACAWLTSSEAGFVTGTNLVVDGGMTRTMIYAE
tara:strand:+ start:362 stop:1117 length:756 start_codon:yes stop_codon:yes gene_type:complete